VIDSSFFSSTVTRWSVNVLKTENFVYRGSPRKYRRSGGRSALFLIAVLAFILVPVCLGLAWFVYRKRILAELRRDDMGYSLMSRDVEMT